jgi:soluble lytic murein transglycosylase-like protein
MKIETPSLATNPRPQTAAEKKAWKAACDFEAIFVRQIFKNMDQANVALGGDQAQHDQAKDIYQDMYNSQLSEAASRSSALGLARWLYPNLLKQDAKGMAGLEKAQDESAATSAALRAYGATSPAGQASAAQGRATPITAGPAMAGLQAHIAQASRTTGVPASLLQGMITVESGGRPEAVSPKGAQGLMQLMPGTAKDLGVTDPHDPAQSVMGGAKYMAQLLKRFDGDERRALAAYNAGPATVEKYGGIPPYAETQKYVEKVQAARRRFEEVP